MKNVQRNTIIMLSMMIICSCKPKEFDARSHAKEYCRCMERERKSGKDIYEAEAMCDGEMVVKNRFFRLDFISFTDAPYIFELPDGLKDSLAEFHFEFYRYVEKNCCKVAVRGCDKADTLQNRINKLKGPLGIH